MRQLKWSGQSDYLKASKEIWRVKSSDKEVAGYVRHAKNLQQVCTYLQCLMLASWWLLVYLLK